MVTPHNLLFIFGTRPEAIKLAPVVKEAVRDPAFRVEACATAQQREMLDQMLQIFEVTSVYDLGLMTDDQSLFGLTGDAIVGIEKVLAEVTRDLVIVQGDTTTTIGAALGTFYRKVPVAYVEAVLRTHQNDAPFPEEVNRRIVSVVVVFPVHLNPNVGRVVLPGLAGVERVRLVPPLDYPSFIQVLRQAHLVLTASAGIQEEAPIFGKPVLVLRDVSERPEGVRASVARLVGASAATILGHARTLLHDAEEHARMARAQSPSADGKANGRIVSLMKRFLDRGMK